LIRTDHPGSAIKFGDQIYELMRAEETVEAGYAYRYGLRSWYFDTTLAGPTLVGFEGALYRPLPWHQEGMGLSRRWIYDLVQLCLSAILHRATIVALTGPAYLILESFYRLYKAKAVGEPAGSIIGYVLRLAIPPRR
jgi:hypothetical protein